MRQPRREGSAPVHHSARSLRQALQNKETHGEHRDRRISCIVGCIVGCIDGCIVVVVVVVVVIVPVTAGFDDHHHNYYYH